MLHRSRAHEGVVGPEGRQVIRSEMDLRPGGTYLYGMQTPDGTVMWGKLVYREIAPKDRLVFINSFSDENGGITRHPMAPTWPMEMMSIFTFEDQPGQDQLHRPLVAAQRHRGRARPSKALARACGRVGTGTLDSLDPISPKPEFGTDGGNPCLSPSSPLSCSFLRRSSSTPPPSRTPSASSARPPSTRRRKKSFRSSTTCMPTRPGRRSRRTPT